VIRKGHFVDIKKYFSVGFSRIFNVPAAYIVEMSYLIPD
jgi:hypothetical protein